MTLLKNYRHIFQTDYTQDPDCVGGWPMQEGTGDYTYDQSDSDVDFEFIGDASWASEDPPISYAPNYIYLDGLNDWLDGNNTTLGLGATSASWAFWARTYEEGLPYNCIFSRKGYNKYAWHTGASSLRSQLGVGAPIFSFAATADDINMVVDEWGHFAYIWDGSNDARMYKNGVEQDLSTAYSASEITNDTAELLIGHIGIGTGPEWWGDITQVIMLVRPLDATEVNDIYDNSIQGSGLTPYPIDRLRKDVQSGYHCFIAAYLSASVGGFAPLKLPDGTVF